MFPAAPSVEDGAAFAAVVFPWKNRGFLLEKKRRIEYNKLL